MSFKCHECKFYKDDNKSICSMCTNNPTYSNNFTKKKLTFENWYYTPESVAFQKSDDILPVKFAKLWKLAQDNK